MNKSEDIRTTASMAGNYIQRIAMVGASGTIGTPILKHLLAAGRFTITIITRANSTSVFPDHPSIMVKKGSYDDQAFLQSAFNGQDAAIFALNVQGTGEQPKLIDAAARAGVKWILPNEFGPDGQNDIIVNGSPFFQEKRGARQQIEQLSQTYPGLSWIGVSTNPWAGHAIHFGLFGVDIRNRTAKLATDSGRFNLTTLDRAGDGIARLLSLPIENAAEPRANLSHYANSFVYISSFSTSQKEAFESVQRATGTTEGDWKIEFQSVADRIKKNNAAMSAGGDGWFPAALDNMAAYYIGEGLGADVQSKALEDLKVLGLEEENADEVIRREIDAGPPKMAG